MGMRPGHQVVFGRQAGGLVVTQYLVPCTWYLVPCTWHLVPCTWCKHLVTQYLTAPTWLPHNSSCLSISVHCRPTRVSSTDQGGRAASGPRILSFQSQKKPKKKRILKKDRFWDLRRMRFQG